MATDIFHQCLVRSQPFAGTHRFLALVGLFTFLSRRPVVNPLRASERNWFRTVILTTKKKSKSEFSALQGSQGPYRCLQQMDYKLNLPSKALQVLIFVSQSLVF